MNCRRGVLAVLVVLLYTLPGIAQWDGEAQQARESLTKLPGVVLEINYSSMDNWPDDPTEREIRASVEKRLQEAGKVVELLLNHAADVNAATPEGFTALMAASALGSPEIVSLLLNKGANKEAQTRAGETALSLAKRFRDRIAGYDRSAEIPDGPDRESTLIKAAQVKHDRIVALLQSSEPANPR